MTSTPLQVATMRRMSNISGHKDSHEVWQNKAAKFDQNWALGSVPNI